MASNSINFSVGFNVDKTAINQLKASLQEIQRMTQSDLNMDDNLNAKQAAVDLEKVKQTAKEVEKALDKAFNKNLGTLNVSKFNQELSKLGLKNIYNQFNSIGSAGQSAFRNMTTEILTTNLQLKQSHKFLNEIATTMGNTIKWGAASSIMNSFTGSVQQAYGYVKALDSSLNDIRIVTGKSNEEMAEFARQANKAAQSLGQGTKDYTEASLIYYQQGLSDAEASARAETTLKAANVTGQSTEAVSEQLTAVWNGYKVSSQEAELYVDKLAAVAATTASDLEELSVGMSKVASAANAMGVDVDSLNAQLATIISVTRQAPESAGTALKTIYARMGDIEAGLDGEVTLDEYTSKMADMGVNVLNANGHLRDMGDVINEIGGNWENLSREQQIALSQIMAGTRQYNNLLALFDNWDMYTDALNTSANAAGTLQQQQDIYMESTEAHLQQLGTAMEDVYDSMFNTESFNKLLDVLTLAVNGLADFVDGIGGGGNALLALGSIATMVFSKQISSGINTVIYNFKSMQENANQVQASIDLLQQFDTLLKENPGMDGMTQHIIKLEQQIISLKDALTPEDFNKLQDYVKKVNEAAQKVDDFKMRQDKVGTLAGKLLGEAIPKSTDTEGIVSWDLIAQKGAEVRASLKQAEISLEDFFTTATKQAEPNIFTTFKKNLDALDIEIEDTKNQIKELGLAIKNNTAVDTNKLAERAFSISTNPAIKQEIRDELLNLTKQLEDPSLEQPTRNALQIRVTNLLEQVNEALISGREKVKGTLRDTINGVGQVYQQEAENLANKAPLQKFVDQLNIEKMVNFARGATQVASGLTAIGNAFKALENPDLEPMEKFAQIVSGLGMGLPMLYSGLVAMSPAILSFAKSIGFASLSINQLFVGVLAAVAIFKTLSFVIDKFTTTQEEAAEATKKSIEEYEKETNALNDLKSKLEEVNSKLDELYTKEELSLTDQNEIANLEAESAELERQVELQERLAELKQQEIAANTKVEIATGAFDFEEKRYEATNYLTGQSVDVDLNNADEVDSKISQLGNQARNARANGLDDWAEWYEEQQAALLTEYNSYINQLAETEAEAKVKLEALLTDPEGNEAEIAKIKDWYAQYYETIGQMEDISMDAFSGIDNIEEKHKKLQEQGPGEDGEWTEEDLKTAGFSTEDIQALKVAADDAYLSLQALTEAFVNAETSSETSSEHMLQRVQEMFSEEGVQLQDSQLTLFSEQINQMLADGIDPGIILEAINSVDVSNLDLEHIIYGWNQFNAIVRETAETTQEEKDKLTFNTELQNLGFNEDQVKTAEALAEDYLELAEAGEEVSEKLLDHPDAAREMAKEVVRVKKGVEDLTKNWKDYNDALNEGVGNPRYSKAIEDIKDHLKDILDLSEEDAGILTDDFVSKNLEDIKAAANGSKEAIDRLRISAAEEIVTTAKVHIEEEDFASFQEDTNAILAMLDDVANEDIQVGASIDDSAYAQQLFDMMTNAGYTAEQIQDTFEKIGWEPEVETRTYTISDEDVRNGYVEVPSMIDAEGLTYGTQRIPLQSSATAHSTISYTVIKGKNGSSGFTPNASRKVSASSGGGGNSGGGGGGGGGGGSKKPKKEKPIESKKDRYHDVNAKLSQIDEELEDIGRDQEKLFGKGLLNALNKELEVLEKQRDVLKEKLDIARDEQAELRAKLALEGVTFNEDGTIANYLTIVQQKEDELNALINQYNAMSAEEQETFMEEVLGPAQEAYEEFIQTIEDYDEVVLETIPGIENDIQESLDREIELNIQKLNMEVELRLDLSEAQKDWSEFKRKVIDGIKDDDLFGNAKADTELFEDLLTNGTIEAGTSNINETIAEIDKMNSGEESSIYGTDKQAAMDNLEEQMKNLMGHLETLTDIQEEIHQSYLEAVDKVGEAFDAQIESYEYVGELIEHNLNLAKLIKGEDAYSDFDAIYDQQEQNNLSTLAAQKEAVDYYRQMMETEEDPEALEKWTEMWKESVSNLNSTVESSVELIVDKYSNTINMIFDEMDKALTDGKGLDYITLEWELINDNADAYLDTINAAYEVQKLERSVIESLNNTDSLYAQQKLNDFMEDELKMLREKEKLTQYDVDRANALYDIKLKEIALEEAQQNKSQMRLRRDSSGNYSYQFVADQDSISAAQQELDDAKNSLYNMDKDAYRENQGAILETYREYQEKMRDAANLSAEERELIEEQYNEKINGLLEENNIIRNNLGESAFSELAALYNSDEANFRDMSMEEQNIMLNEIIPHWDGSINTMIDKMANPEDGFSVVCRKAMEQLDIATKEYDTSLKLIETTSGQTFGTLATNQSENIELARELAEAAQEVIDKAINEKIAIEELQGVVDGLALSYEAVKTAAEGALTAAQNLMEFERKKAADEAEAERKRREEEEKNSGGQGSADTGGGGSGGGGTPQETPDNSNLAEGVAASIWLHGSNTSGWGKGATRAQRFNEKGVSAAQALLNKAEWHNDTTLYKNWIGRQDELKKYYYKAFDTGGYTGEWGDEGKLAVLHEKELILNKDDTKNILAAVSLARTMESIISSLNDSLISRASGLTSGLVANPNLGNSGQQEIQQNISIEANFPNVSSRTEIEDAFKNLVNVASQHAFNTQR